MKLPRAAAPRRRAARGPARGPRVCRAGPPAPQALKLQAAPGARPRRAAPGRLGSLGVPATSATPRASPAEARPAASSEGGGRPRPTAGGREQYWWVRKKPARDGLKPSPAGITIHGAATRQALRLKPRGRPKWLHPKQAMRPASPLAVREGARGPSGLWPSSPADSRAPPCSRRSWRNWRRSTRRCRRATSLPVASRRRGRRRRRRRRRPSSVVRRPPPSSSVVCRRRRRRRRQSSVVVIVLGSSASAPRIVLGPRPRPGRRHRPRPGGLPPPLRVEAAPADLLQGGRHGPVEQETGSARSGRSRARPRAPSGARGPRSASTRPAASCPPASRASPGRQVHLLQPIAYSSPPTAPRECPAAAGHSTPQTGTTPCASWSCW